MGVGKQNIRTKCMCLLATSDPRAMRLEAARDVLLDLGLSPQRGHGCGWTAACSKAMQGKCGGIARARTIPERPAECWVTDDPGRTCATGYVPPCQQNGGVERESTTTGICEGEGGVARGRHGLVSMG